MVLTNTISAKIRNQYAVRNLQYVESAGWRGWGCLEHGANSAAVVGSIPRWATHSELDFMALLGPFLPRIFCGFIWPPNTFGSSPFLPNVVLLHTLSVVGGFSLSGEVP